MSDYDDDVDMDSTAQAAMKFSSDNTKGKKIVADLPIGAEDNLPW
jgi:replication factor C subunit 3/5